MYAGIFLSFAFLCVFHPVIQRLETGPVTMKLNHFSFLIKLAVVSEDLLQVQVNIGRLKTRILHLKVTCSFTTIYL